MTSAIVNKKKLDILFYENDDLKSLLKVMLKNEAVSYIVFKICQLNNDTTISSIDDLSTRVRLKVKLTLI